MAIYDDRLGVSVTGEPFEWSNDDVSLYALSVGASGDGLSELDFTTTDAADTPQVVPTFAVILTMKSQSSPLKLVGDFPLSRIIHAGQQVEVVNPIPASGSAQGTTEVTGIYDAGKHAIIETTTTVRNGNTVYVKTVSTVLILGEGGFGGPPPPAKLEVPSSAPNGSLTFNTRADQALLYRLNGDRNPLHFDPDMATSVGFERPIMHGLGSFGMVARQLIQELYDSDPLTFKSLQVRFVKPVYPGDILTTSWWRTENGVAFQTHVGEQLVLDGGHGALR